VIKINIARQNNFRKAVDEKAAALSFWNGTGSGEGADSPAAAKDVLWRLQLK